MANAIQRNVDALKSALVEQQNYSELFGNADPRIVSVLSYLNSDYDMHTWPRPMRDAICVERVDDWTMYLSGVMSMMILAIANGEKPSKEQVSSLKYRLKYCAPCVNWAGKHPVSSPMAR